MKTTDTNFTTDVSVNKQQPILEVIRHWIYDFFRDFSTLQDRAFFHNFAHISDSTDRIFTKILPQMYHQRRK